MSETCSKPQITKNAVQSAVQHAQLPEMYPHRPPWPFLSASFASFLHSQVKYYGAEYKAQCPLHPVSMYAWPIYGVSRAIASIYLKAKHCNL